MAVFRRSIIIQAVIVLLACILPSYCETESQAGASEELEFVTLMRDRRGAEEKYYKDTYGGDRRVDYGQKDNKAIDYKGDEYYEYEYGPFYDYRKLYKPKYSPGSKYYNRYPPHGYPRSHQYYPDSYDRHNSRPYYKQYSRYQRKSYPRHSDYYSRRDY